MFCWTVEDGIGALGYVYFGLPLLLALLFPMVWRFLSWGAGVWIASGLTLLLKYIAAPLTPQWTFLQRPQGAYNCNGAANDGDQSGAPGFPSGHSATAAAFWMGAFLLVPPSYKVVTAYVGVVATATMMWSRMRKHCHTGLQTMVGALLGAGVASVIL